MTEENLKNDGKNELRKEFAIWRAFDVKYLSRYLKNIKLSLTAQV